MKTITWPGNCVANCVGLYYVFIFYQSIKFNSIQFYLYKTFNIVTKQLYRTQNVDLYLHLTLVERFYLFQASGPFWLQQRYKCWVSVMLFNEVFNDKLFLVNAVKWQWLFKLVRLWVVYQKVKGSSPSTAMLPPLDPWSKALNRVLHGAVSKLTLHSDPNFLCWDVRGKEFH